MRTFGEVEEELLRPVVLAVSNAEEVQRRAEAERQGKDSRRLQLQENLKDLQQQHRSLDSPLEQSRKAIEDLKARSRDIQRQIEQKERQLAEDHARADSFAAELKKRRMEMAALDSEILRSAAIVEEKQAEVTLAHGRLTEARRRLSDTVDDIGWGFRLKKKRTRPRSALATVGSPGFILCRGDP